MSLFAVTREAGPAWAAGGIWDQPGVAEHGAFMQGLADEGVVLFGGPLAGSETGRLRALILIEAENEDEVTRHLADDPWVATRQLETVRVEPWLVPVGASPARA